MEEQLFVAAVILVRQGRYLAFGLHFHSVDFDGDQGSHSGPFHDLEALDRILLAAVHVDHNHHSVSGTCYSLTAALVHHIVGEGIFVEVRVLDRIIVEEEGVHPLAVLFLL